MPSNGKISESAKFLAKETSMEQLWTREMFLWKLRWGILLWLFVWLFLPHSTDFSEFMAFCLLGAGFIYNLAVSIATTLRYKRILSGLTITIDSFAVTAAVYITGGINSELWPLYFLLIISSSMIINFKSEIILLSFVCFLYLIATLPGITSEIYVSILLNRLLILSVVTFAAGFISGIERNLRKRVEGVAEENAQLYEKVSKFNEELERKIEKETAGLKEKYAQLDILYRINKAVTSDIELDKIFSAIIKGVQEGLGFDRVGIFEVDAEQDCVRGRLGVDQFGKQENIEKEKYPLKEGDNNFAKIATGKLKFFFTENADLSLPSSQKKYMISGVGQNAVVPMEARGRVIGMIAVDNFITKKPIMKEDIHLLMTFADQAAIALQNARMFGKERDASVRFKKLEDTKNNIISKLSHELRTPLVSIKQSISLVLQRIAGEITANEEKFLNIAMNNTERLTLLIDELLESAKMETLETKLEFSPINLAELVDEVLSEIELQADVKDVSIKAEMPDSIPVIHGDKNKLFRVLSNLIGNAIKYSNNKGRLAISADQNDKDVLVSVKDDGIGIEEANLKSVFEKFYRVDDPSVRERGGIGLGLTISREIVEAHGGHIWVESEGKGKGSTFTFSLPKG